MGDWLAGVGWDELLVPQTPLLEIVVRGSAVYLGLFAILRGVLKRETGAVGITDLLVVVLLAEAAQNGLAAESTALPDTLVLVATVVFWAYALNWLGYRFPRIQRLLHPPPLPLVEDGRMLRRNMRRELVTEDELMGQIRLQGGAEPGDVKSAFMEADGNISVILGTGCDDGAPGRSA